MAQRGAVGDRGDGSRPSGVHQPQGAGGLPMERPSNAKYSLDALKHACENDPPIRYSGPDSGKIDLSKLPRTSPAAAPSVLDALPALQAPVSAGRGQQPDAQRPRRSTAGLGIGISVAGIVIAGAILYGLRTPPPAQASSAVSSDAQPVASSPAATAPAIASAPPLSSAPAAASSAPQVSTARSGPSKKARAAAVEEDPYPPDPPTTTTQTAAPPPKPPNPCGCAPEDLKCNMDCAVKGKK